MLIRGRPPARHELDHRDPTRRHPWHDQAGQVSTQDMTSSVMRAVPGAHVARAPPADPSPPVHPGRCRLGHPNRSPDVPPSRYPRPQLLLEAGAGRLPGPGPAVAADRYPAVTLGAAAEDRAILGLLLAPAGPGGRLGDVEVLGRVNPRALWKQRVAMPKVAMLGVHFLGCYIRWAGRPSPCPSLWPGASAQSLEGCRPT